MDQAEGLRTLTKKTGEEMVLSSAPQGRTSGFSGSPSPRVISITSGKGGVGKTNIVANLALAAARSGKRVLVLDADLGLANIDVLLGLAPRYTIEHLMSREKSLAEILVKGPGGIWILPAASGVLDLVDLDEHRKMALLNEFDLLAGSIDLLLIDTGAGISSNVLYFNMAAQESMVVVTPEPTSITDAYALIKVLFTKYRKRHFMILVNFASSEGEGKEVFRRISKVTDRFLGSLSLDYLGSIPTDEKLPLAVKCQKPVLEIYPLAPSSRCFTELSGAISERPLRDETRGHVQFFWKQLLQNHPRTLQQEEVD